MAVEQWLRDLELAPRTKVHIRSTMHVLFGVLPDGNSSKRIPSLAFGKVVRVSLTLRFSQPRRQHQDASSSKTRTTRA